MIKKNLLRISLVFLLVATIFASAILAPRKASADYNYLCNDLAFTNWASSSVGEIQYFLTANGSFLKDFSENGRSAAQIIYDASHAHGDASGSINGITIDSSTGTVNPIAILATIQKEEGLVTGFYSQPANYNQTRVDWAMGYGYTDDIIYQQYKGFTKQVEWGAWQLRYNYERASGHGFGDYQVGQVATIDDTSVTFNNRCTASLYRYTPHLGGNQNFAYYFNAWGGNNISGIFQAQYVSQTLHSFGIGNGEIVTNTISYLNTGSMSWYKGVVNLGLVNQNYNWIGNYDMSWGWPKTDRLAYLNQDAVAPGEVGTFTFQVKNNAAAVGNHRLDAGLVADGVAWFFSNTHAYWDVWAPPLPPAFSAQYISQVPHNFGIASGEVVTDVISYRNTGSRTWLKGQVNLGLVNQNYNWISSYDMAYNWPKADRLAYLDQDSVAPGAIGTFTFQVTNNGASSGNHRLDAGLVADGITWFPLNTHSYWDVWAP